MDSSTFLIVGANGQLGTALREKYPDARAVDSGELDITDRDAVLGFDWSGITTIINAAGYTNVDGAETDEGRKLAWLINGNGTINLTNTAITHGLTMVHISTDYVFDGTKESHDELEPFTPLGVYAQTKAAADLAVTLAPKHYILRTSWVMGSGRNFVRTMLDLGERGVSPSVVTDQIGRPTFTNELVSIIDHLLSSSAEFGTYNSTNSGDPASWAEVARLAFEYADFNIAISEISTSQYSEGKSGIAPRPANSTLDLRKLNNIGYNPRDWRLALGAYIEKEQSK